MDSRYRRQRERKFFFTRRRNRNPAHAGDWTKALNGEKKIIAGYRDELFLTEELKKAGDFYPATEDGSAGTRGNVLDAIREKNLEADVIFACGPTPMLRAVKAYAEEKNIACGSPWKKRWPAGSEPAWPVWCQSREVDGHSHVHNKRICKDGPVFPASEVEL